MGAKVAATALFFFLLVSSGFGKKHTPCEGPSQTFKGNCQDADCTAACITEDYKGGYCDVGGTVECMCTNFCHDGQPPKKVDLAEAKVRH